MYPGNAISFRN